MGFKKQTIIAAAAIIGIAQIAIGLFFIYFGVSAGQSETLTIIEQQARASYTLTFTGGILLLTSGIGWTAATQKSEWLSFLFGWLSITIFLVMSACGFGLLVMKNKIGDNILDSCATESGVFYEIDQIYTQGAQILCTEQCPCKGEVGVTDPYGASNVLACPGGDQVLTPMMEDKYGNWLILLEQELQCSGMCSSIGYYEFTSTANGAPAGACAAEITRVVEENAGRIAGWCLAFSAVSFTGAMIAILINYIERRHFVPSNYSRYTDWGLK